jgi:hypothetical protein
LTNGAGFPRRDFLKWSGSALAGLVPLSRGTEPANRPERPAAGYDFLEPDSTFFSTVFAEYAASYGTRSDGDLWPSAWADDGHIYTANGDGTGFGNSAASDVVVSRIAGMPETGLSGTRLSSGAAVADVWGDPSEYNRKPTGMLAVDGNHDGRDEIYVAVQDLRYSPAADAFNDAPNASISMSLDYGETWCKTTRPMFTGHMFTTIFFLDYGQSQRYADVLGAEGAAYVYAYGLDNNWRGSYSGTVPSPADLYLARAPRASVQERSTWEFYAGKGPANRPRWSSDIIRKAPVLHDARRIYPSLFTNNGPTNLSVVSQGGVVYDPALDRYLYTSWTEYTFEFYEAPEPWGPWRLFMTKDAGAYPWYGRGRSSTGCPGPKNGGYGVTIPSKFISPDGHDMWLQSNWFVGNGCGAPNYGFSLRKFRVAPYKPTAPRNAPGPSDNLARTGDGVTPIEKSAHFGHGDFYNDGTKDRSEDSFDGSRKTVDFWGYTLDRECYFDRVVYTTGTMFGDGGWFRDGLRAQVRQHFRWVDVEGLVISPPYPYDATAGPAQSYTLRFRKTAGDGARIVGTPGGDHNFTSIAELELYYDGGR